MIGIRTTIWVHIVVRIPIIEDDPVAAGVPGAKSRSVGLSVTLFLDDVRRRPWRYTSSSETQATITDPVDDSASTVTRAVERAYRMSRRPFTRYGGLSLGR
jgi:hypothetical protein